jgi:hypothetical protein
MSIGPQHNGGILGATNNPTSTSAGGIWTPVQHYQAQRDGLWPVATAPLPDYTISRSLRFNSADPGYLSWTPGTIGNRRTWTWSGWVKKTVIATECKLFGSGATSSDHTYIMFSDNIYTDNLSIAYFNGSTHVWRLITTQVFRDPSAWYHIIVAFDSTLSTATDRVKVYVNGTQVTSFQVRVDPALNVETYINSNNTHYLGTQSSQITTSFNGYLADVRLIDGQQLTPSSFGETDLTTGVWRPKAYSGSYGTNGFYLPFTDNSTQNNLGVNTAQVGDELRNYTVLHLSGNPANTSGYNCFSDRSSNNHLLTIAGDVRTSARSPFTDTASGSAYFDGSSDYITVTNNNLFPATSTTAFTLEAWVYPTTSSGNYILTSPVASNTVRYCFMLGTNPDNSSGTKVVFGRFSAAWTYLASATSVSLNTWTHIACVFTGSTSQIYINGTLDASGGASTWVTGGSSTLTLGYRWDEYAPGAPFYFTGNLSNVRVTTGQALFTGNFTPSSSPLTSTAVGHTGTGAASSITGTVSLLTLVDKVGANNSGFIDESTNNAVITRSGNVTQGSFSPFGTSGWSNYFKGSGDYLQLTGTSAFNMSTYGCLEAWVYLNSSGTNQLIAGRDSSYWIAYNFSGIGGVANKFVFTIYNGSSWQAVSSNISPSLGVWYHIVGIKDNTTLRIYINGIQENTATFSGSPNTPAGVIIGVAANQNTENLTGYISNVRFNIGSNSSILPYTSNFTPSTTPLTATTGTVLLTCQNNRFVDNSANNFAITVNGTPQVQPLSPFQPHTSVTNTYSTYLNGSSSLTPNSGGMLALGTNPYTIEFFVYITTHSNGHALAANDQDGLVVVINSTKTSLNKYNVGDVVATNAGLSTNVWHHIAIVRTSTAANQTILYIDGSQAAVGTDSNNWTVTANPRIGGNVADQRITGYISNLRIVSSALYSGTNITVPTAPFSSSQTGTLFLACQSSTLIDSTNNYTIASVTGNPLLTEFNPLGRTFTTGVNYSATTHGSSAYFDGDVDHITTTTVNFSNQNYTIECWAYPTQLGDSYLWQISNPSSGARGSSTVTGAWYSSTGKFIWFSAGGSFGGSSFDIAHSVTSPLNTWTHIALVRNGNTFTQYINGVAVGSATVNATYTSAGTAFSMGRYYGNSGDGNFYFKGYIANYRQINGTALYTSNFVPQLQPPQAVANTQLLLNFNNAGVVDYTGKNVLETAGTSKSITSTKKTITDATGSLYFDGTVGNVLQSASNQVLAPGTGDFTLEAWVYFNSAGVDPGIVQIGPSLPGTNTPGYTNSIGLARATTGGYNGNLYIIQSGANYVSSGILTIGTWHHTAVVRQSGVQKVYLNGVLVGSVNDTNNYTGTYLFAGCIYGTNYPINGYIQDIRYTKVARYTGTFTPPVRTFSATVRDVGHKQWVVNNLSVASGAGNDSLVDSPTNYGVDTGLGGEVRGNYCIWNPLNATGASTANGNLEATLTGNASLNAQIRGTIAPISGKWYWENIITVDGNQSHWLGVIAASARADIRLDNSNAFSQVVYARYDGQKIVNGTISAYGASYTTGDIIGIALNLDLSTITFYKNNVSQGTLSLPTSGIAYVPVFWYSTADTGASGTVAANFGQRPFAYTAPSGYKALCTQNLPTPSIIKSNTAFDTLAYAGNDSQTISGLNFSPDLVWVKSRSNATYNHQVHDSVRGPTAGMLSTNSNAAENNTYQFTSFNNNGFTTASGNIAGINNSGNTFVAWAWDAGTSTVTNTAGNVTSQVRANPTAGISIVTYTGSNTTNGTVGHGLGVAPSFIILKNRSTDGWFVGHSSLGWLGNLRLEAQATFYNDSSNAPWGDTAPTSTVFTVSIGGGGWANASGNNYVAYCFAPISGFSAFGSYTGNGSTNGPFVYTGFKPRWVMIKRSDGAYSWWINDGARNPYNVVGQDLAANEITAESNDAPVQDFLSNGFKLRTSIYPGFNASGGNYVYAAFAENPFKYSLAR